MCVGGKDDQRLVVGNDGYIKAGCWTEGEV